MTAEFEPKIIAFMCNWCAYSAADLAGSARLPYPDNTSIVILPCSGRVDEAMILKAFEKGADGVMVVGCLEGDCHYLAGNLRARARRCGDSDIRRHLLAAPRRADAPPAASESRCGVGISLPNTTKINFDPVLTIPNAPASAEAKRNELATSIIQVIQDRKYAEQIDRRFYATDLGEVVTDKLSEYFPRIMDIAFTRHMEQQLDKIGKELQDG